MLMMMSANDDDNDANNVVNANNADNAEGTRKRCQQHPKPPVRSTIASSTREPHHEPKPTPRFGGPRIVNAGSSALSACTKLTASPSILSAAPHSTLRIPVGPPSCRIHLSIDREGDTLMGMPDRESVAPSTVLEQGKAVHHLEYDISNLPTPEHQHLQMDHQGNVHNFGDPSPAESDVEAPLPRGCANLMITSEWPSTLTVNNASSVLKVNTSCYQTMSPVLKQISRQYSPVCKGNQWAYWVGTRWLLRMIHLVNGYSLTWSYHPSPYETGVMDGKSVSLMESTFVASMIPPSFHSHSSQSRLVSLARTVTSHSRSPSAASTSIQEGLSSGGPSKMPQDHKELLLSFLGIDSTTPYLPFNLHNAFIKHCAIMEATPTVMKLCHDEEWQALVGDEDQFWYPKLTDFIDIFIANTQYYGNWKKPFSVVMMYPDMCDWLEKLEDRKSDSDVWGFSSQFLILWRS
ncbi:hypothetical protein CPB84DRAFT_1854168 [Gymnopilus junonius]|uniref:Uncharacterized protein n=1 Tax=Gymnopilus junonius TaxID=109634 RepID=A0A9P5NB16_GYMJU|nr:hypothetical protein CPB84DRAFT_1854168 [Gymnopilus junonius]